jgi:ATP-dependent Clp protease ATP-binding subunit ClpX
MARRGQGGFTEGPAPEQPAAELRCSFCGKHRDQVRSMVAGQRLRIADQTRHIAICNECVELCNEIFAEQVEPGPQPD